MGQKATSVVNVLGQMAQLVRGAGHVVAVIVGVRGGGGRSTMGHVTVVNRFNWPEVWLPLGS